MGQSPRDDIVPGFLHGLGGRVELVQAGALDGAGSTS
ncbi:MAG: AroM family protein, partial [Bacillota bacterium]